MLRRSLLASAGLGLSACSLTPRIVGGLPWSPDRTDPPASVQPGPWVWFTPEEGAAVEAVVDRLIPPDPQTPGGRDAGCAVFIDRQLAGPYGSSRGLYMSPPFFQAPPDQGPQSPDTPATRYRGGLAALAAHCRIAYAGRSLRELPEAEQDRLLRAMEAGTVTLDGSDARMFFRLLLQNTMEGFFADPLYGGNRDMAGWRMIGFPGARYDFRDWVDHHDEHYAAGPVGITGSPAWR